MKPSIILFNLLAMLAVKGFGQSSPSIIASAGGTGTATEISLEWTIGEPISGSGSNTSVLLTQGFEQPVIIVSEALPAIAGKAAPSSGFSVFPNPASATFNVKTPAGINEKAVINLLDLNGNVLITRMVNASNELQQIDMTRLPAATYLLRVSNVYGAVLSASRIVKVK